MVRHSFPGDPPEGGVMQRHEDPPTIANSAASKTNAATPTNNPSSQHTESKVNELEDRDAPHEGLQSTLKERETSLTTTPQKNSKLVVETEADHLAENRTAATDGSLETNPSKASSNSGDLPSSLLGLSSDMKGHPKIPRRNRAMGTPSRYSRHSRQSSKGEVLVVPTGSAQKVTPAKVPTTKIVIENMPPSTPVETATPTQPPRENPPSTPATEGDDSKAMPSSGASASKATYLTRKAHQFSSLKKKRNTNLLHKLFCAPDADDLDEEDLIAKNDPMQFAMADSADRSDDDVVERIRADIAEDQKRKQVDAEETQIETEPSFLSMDSSIDVRQSISTAVKEALDSVGAATPDRKTQSMPKVPEEKSMEKSYQEKPKWKRKDEEQTPAAAFKQKALEASRRSSAGSSYKGQSNPTPKKKEIMSAPKAAVPTPAGKSLFPSTIEYWEKIASGSKQNPSSSLTASSMVVTVNASDSTSEEHEVVLQEAGETRNPPTEDYQGAAQRQEPSSDRSVEQREVEKTESHDISVKSVPSDEPVLSKTEEEDIVKNRSFKKNNQAHSPMRAALKKFQKGDVGSMGNAFSDEKTLEVAQKEWQKQHEHLLSQERNKWMAKMERKNEEVQKLREQLESQEAGDTVVASVSRSGDIHSSTAHSERLLQEHSLQWKEEHEVELKQIKNKYEKKLLDKKDEISLANRKIKLQQEELDRLEVQLRDGGIEPAKPSFASRHFDSIDNDRLKSVKQSEHDTAIAELQGEVEKYKKELEAAKTEIEGSQYSRLKKFNQGTISESYIIEIETLSKELNSVNSELEIVKKKYAEGEETIKKMKSDLAKNEMEAKRLRKMENERNTLKKRVEDLEKEVLSVPERQKAVSEKEAAVAKMESDLEERQRAVESTEATWSDRVKAMEEKESALDAKEKQMDSQIQDSISERKAAMEKKEASLKEMEITLVTLKKTLDEHESSIRQRELAVADKELAIHAKERALDRNERAIKEKDVELQARETGLAVSKEKVATNLKEIETMKRELARTKENLQAERQDVETLKTDAEQMILHIEAEKDELAETKKEVRAARVDLETEKKLMNARLEAESPIFKRSAIPRAKTSTPTRSSRSSTPKRSSTPTSQSPGSNVDVLEREKMILKQTIVEIEESSAQKQDELEQMIKDTRKACDEELMAMRQEMEQKLADQSGLQDELQFDLNKPQASKKIQELEEKVAQLEKEKDDIKKTAEDELARLEKELDQKLSESNDNKKEHELVLSQLRINHEDELARVKRDMENRLAEQKEQEASIRESITEAASTDKGELLKKIESIENEKMEAHEEGIREAQEKEKLRKKVESLEASIKEKEESLEALEDEKSTAIRELKKEIKTQKSLVEDKEDEIESLKQSMSKERDSIEKEVKLLEKQIEEEKSMIKSLEMKVECLEREARESEAAHIEELAEQQYRLGLETKALQETIGAGSGAGEAFKIFQREKNELLAQIRDMEKQMQQAQTERVEKLEAFKEQHSQHVEKLRKESASKLEEAQKLHELKIEELEKSIAQLKDQEEETRTVKKELEDQRKVYDEQIQEIAQKHAKELEELIAQLDLVEKDHEEKLKASMSSAEEKDKIITAMSERLAEAMDRFKNLQEDSKNVVALQENLTEALVQIETLKAELVDLHLSHKEVLLEQDKLREAACEEAREEMITKAESQFKLANDTYIKLKKNYDGCKSKIETLKQEIKDNKIAEDMLRQEISEQKAINDKMQADSAVKAQEHRNEIEQLLLAAEELDKRSGNHSKSMKALEKKLAESEAEKAQLAADLEKLYQEHAELRAVCEELMSELEGGQ